MNNASRNHDAPVGQKTAVVRKTYASSLINDRKPGKLLLKYFKVKSITNPKRQKHTYGTSNLLTEILQISLVAFFLKVIPPLKKNHAMKKNSRLLTNSIYLFSDIEQAYAI